MANFDQNGHHARGIRPFLEMGFGALSEEFTNSSETIEEDECRESQLSFINHLPLDLTRLRGTSPWADSIAPRIPPDHSAVLACRSEWRC